MYLTFYEKLPKFRITDLCSFLSLFSHLAVFLTILDFFFCLLTINSLLCAYNRFPSLLVHNEQLLPLAFFFLFGIVLFAYYTSMVAVLR